MKDVWDKDLSLHRKEEQYTEELGKYLQQLRALRELVCVRMENSKLDNRSCTIQQSSIRVNKKEATDETISNK